MRIVVWMQRDALLRTRFRHMFVLLTKTTCWRLRQNLLCHLSADLMASSLRTPSCCHCVCTEGLLVPFVLGRGVRRTCRVGVLQQSTCSSLPAPCWQKRAKQSPCWKVAEKCNYKAFSHRTYEGHGLRFRKCTRKPTVSARGLDAITHVPSRCSRVWLPSATLNLLSSRLFWMKMLLIQVVSGSRSTWTFFNKCTLMSCTHFLWKGWPSILFLQVGFLPHRWMLRRSEHFVSTCFPGFVHSCYCSFTQRLFSEFPEQPLGPRGCLLVLDSKLQQSGVLHHCFQPWSQLVVPTISVKRWSGSR